MTSWRGDSRSATARHFSTAARMLAASLRAGSTIEIPSTSEMESGFSGTDTGPVYGGDSGSQPGLAEHLKTGTGSRYHRGRFRCCSPYVQLSSPPTVVTGPGHRSIETVRTGKPFGIRGRTRK